MAGKSFTGKMGKFLRITCAVASALAGVVLVFLCVVLVLDAMRKQIIAPGMLAATAFVGILGMFAFYMSSNLWRESLGSSRIVISKLRVLDPHSTEFCDVATAYFRRRLCVVRNCGMFFIFFAATCLLLLGTVKKNWQLDLCMICGTFFCATIGWPTYQRVKHGVRILDIARKLDFQYRMEALRLTAGVSFRYDPVGIFVAERFSPREDSASPV